MPHYEVVKFGGSSFTRDSSYQEIAKYIEQKVTAGRSVCVVVSAMSGTTGALGELLDAVCEKWRLQDRDAVLTTGELLSSALLCASLAQIGITVKQLNAYNLGWISDDNFTNARLLHCAPEPMLAAFCDSQVVVVAGGQAVTRSGDIAMLGRNSSDLTALVCAKILGVGNARIYSDVEGVYTADPYKVPEAQLIPTLSYDAAEHYAKAGAKVLHPACLAYAKQYSIEIECAYYCQESRRTSVGSVISHVGDGVQLLFLNEEFLVWETAEKAEFERWHADCRSRNISFYSSQLESWRIAVRSKEAVSLSWRAARSLHTGEHLLLTFDELNATTLHVVSEQKDVREIHERLVDGRGYRRVERAVFKNKSRHSRVYDPRFSGGD
jgi:aspartate kinase